jgi:hypothetical protein
MSEHHKHLGMAANHFAKLASHHDALAQVHKDLAQAYFGEGEKAAVHHMHGERMAALHKSAAAHHLTMKAHAYEMAKALREDADGEPNVDEMTEDNVPSFGSDTFEGAAEAEFVKDFVRADHTSAVPTRVSATGTLGDPRKVPGKLVFRAGQEELFDPFGKGSASDESDLLPGMPPFEKAN